MMTYGLEIECGGLRTEDELRQVIAGTRGVEYGGHFGYHGSRRLGLRCVENGNENLWVSENDGSLTAGNEGYTTPPRWTERPRPRSHFTSPSWCERIDTGSNGDEVTQPSRLYCGPTLWAFMSLLESPTPAPGSAE